MKSRRGLSSVVGMVFAIIALTSTVAYVTYSMNTVNQFGQTVITRSQQTLNEQNENFQITNVGIVNNKFNITAVNTGSIPINFTNVWITNSSATNMDWTRSYTTNNFVGPGASIKNIGQNLPVSALSTNSYNIKLVTSRGNSYQFSVNAVNKSPLPLQLIASPSTVPTGFQTTILLTVTNNMTNAILTNVSPNTLGIISNTGVTSSCSSPTPSSYPVIPVGTTVIFQWTCTESGNVETAITYNATLQNGYNHNYVSTTVTIGEVEFAAQSASSVTAQGLNAVPSANTVLQFDQNQFSVPYGGYQMYNTQANNSTNTFLSLDTLGGASFYTDNGTAVSVNAGTWNATLRYISAPVPSVSFSSSQYPDVAFHFENSLGNSMSNNANLAAHGGATWSSTGGVNGTGAYPLGSSQYLDASVSSGYTNIPSGSTKVDTAMWFKTSQSCGGTCTLLRIGDSNTGPYYIIYISGHTVTFKFSDHANINGNTNGGQIDATCTSTNTITVDNQKWHHIVVEKTGTRGCNLYLDGSASGTTQTQGTACITGGSGDCQNISGHFDIGRDQAVTGNYLVGTVDDLMHWNNGNINTSAFNPSQTQVTDLLKTSYGANAETVTFNIFTTNYDGTCSTGNGGLNGNCADIISQSVNVQLPFMDGKYTSGGQVSYSNPSASSSTWGHYNYTVTLPQESFSSTQRLEFQIKFVTQTYGQLGMKMIIDNTGLSDQYGQSLLQTPPVTAPFMGYYIYLANSCSSNDNNYNGDNDGNVYVYNAGPDIAWVQQGSRAIFTTYDKSGAYAGWIFFTSGGYGHHYSQSARTDSVEAPVGTSTLLYYSTPYTQPGLDTYQGGTRIPSGNYNLYIYLFGYDQEGHSLLSTDFIGPVRVYYTNDGC